LRGAALCADNRCPPRETDSGFFRSLRADENATGQLSLFPAISDNTNDRERLTTKEESVPTSSWPDAQLASRANPKHQFPWICVPSPWSGD
jgi:hypothetical protein